MYSRLSSIVLLALLAVPGYAATLKGVILTNGVGGAPMGNAEVGAVAGANQTVSDVGGRFTLEFPKKQPGDIVRVLVNQTGQVVVNDVQLELALPTDPDAKTLIIILCQEEVREEMARRFYRLKSFDGLEETYQKKVRELEQ